MIVRVFRAQALPGKAAKLEQEFEQDSIPLVEAQQGVFTYYAARPIGSASDAFVMITIWEDLDAVKAFAGPNWEQPVISDSMAPLLASSSLDHYDVFGTGLNWHGS